MDEHVQSQTPQRQALDPRELFSETREARGAPQRQAEQQTIRGEEHSEEHHSRDKVANAASDFEGEGRASVEPVIRQQSYRGRNPGSAPECGHESHPDQRGIDSPPEAFPGGRRAMRERVADEQRIDLEPREQQPCLAQGPTSRDFSTKRRASACLRDRQ